MIPYLGCKQSFASELLAAMPEAENFYDLFGGGGSITEAAFRCREDGFFGKWQKWKSIHYNELCRGVYLLNKAIWSGKFDFEYAKAQIPTKERYYAERRQPTAWGAFASFVWSFGNKDDSFVYGKRKGAARGSEHLSRIRRMRRSPLLPDAIMTCKDYRKVAIKPNSVAYCDIPYYTERKYYRVVFDHLAFCNWAATRSFPVYFSEYECHDKRFQLVTEIDVLVKINTVLSGGKAIRRTEKLFWNGVS